MRRLLLAALTFAVIAGTFAGVASARLAPDAPKGADAAPFRAPAALPAEDPGQPGAYAFRSSAAIAARYQSPEAAPGASTGASASVTVTAIVLPVVTIVVDEDGAVLELVTNTSERDARGVLYVVREGSTDGAPVPLDRSAWAAARAALAEAHEGTGTIWSA